ncbi:MAG: hypothetical protein E7300_00955 [Lachnospiraceae bacterium]|nr:hypothetical protein [Lachnospiraceae bacterium]
MGIVSWLKGVIGKMFEGDATREFNATVIHSGKMEAAVRRWEQIYAGSPDWLDEEDGVKTINFAKSITEETARLTTLDIDVNISGSPRADFLQKELDALKVKFRDFVEQMTMAGTIALKPNGIGVDFVTPDNFLITDIDGNRNIIGVIFFDYYDAGDRHYTRMEWHRFEGVQYLISNRTYCSKTAGEIGKPVPIETTPTWSQLLPEVALTKADGTRLDKPLFAICKMPAANNIDRSSPLGMSIYAQAIEEMKDLDIAYSRNAYELFNSQDIELLDDRLLRAPGQKVAGPMDIKLPKHVLNVTGSSDKEFYQAIDRPLKTDIRIQGINHLLSMIGYKCGFSDGYFVLDQKTGMVTATQVEADDRRTIQLIKDIRDQIKAAVEQLVYALDKYADLYSDVPAGEYELDFSFGDIVYNFEDDKNRHWQYVQSGKFPLWRYFVKFEGYSEEEAKEIAEEVAGSTQEGLFK